MQDEKPDMDDSTDVSADVQESKSQVLAKLEPDTLPATRLGAAAPSKPARALAFVSIVVAGVCGALIGYAFTDLQCADGCTGWAGFGAVVGGLVGAIGVAIVAVLVLRAMDEWETVKGSEPRDHPARDRPERSSK
jgi:hypothetical protein